MLKNNDWIILNAITFKIHSIKDLDEMRLSIMEHLHYLIPYDSASFYIVSPTDPDSLIRPVGINYEFDDMMQYVNTFKKLDYSEGLMFTGKNIAYRESDIVPDEIRVNTDYYKAVYDAQGWHYSLHLNICHQEIFQGVLSFFRKKGEPDFTYDDIFVLDMLKDHLALRLDQEREKSKAKKQTVSDCIQAFQLSPREGAVLELLIHDQTAEEIAATLDITVSTLRKHCHRIYQKLGISNRIHLNDLIER